MAQRVVVGFETNLYVYSSSDGSPWMLNVIWVAFPLVYISEDKGRTSADILLFKTHVEAAVQMTKNLKFWGGTKIQEWNSTKSCQSDINAVVFCYFHFIFRIFVLGHHHGFGNCGGLGKGKYTHEVGVRWTNGREGRGRKNSLFQLPHNLSTHPAHSVPTLY